MTPGAEKRSRIFVSYSRRDRKWLDELKIHLEPVVPDQLDVWDDTRIKVGAHWSDEIREALDSTRIAVLLVSPNFLASDFICRHEFPALLRAEREGGLTVIWIAVSASSYMVSQIKDYQAANDPKRPLDTLPGAKRNQVWVEIVRQIVEAGAALSEDNGHRIDEDLAGASPHESLRGGRVVLLYKHRAQPDLEVLQLIEREMNERNIPIYIDRHSTAGIGWGKQIADQVRNAEAVIPLLSAASVKSEMLSYEVHIAHQARQERGDKPRIIPIRVRYYGDLPETLNEIAPLHHLQWEGSDDNQRLVSSLIDALQAPAPEAPQNLRLVTGAVPLDDEYYVERAPDGDLRAGLSTLESIILIKGPRQAGKTSLLARGACWARESGFRVFYTDFQAMNTRELNSLDTMYQSLIDRLVDALHLDVSVEQMWNPKRAPNRNLERFLSGSILPVVDRGLVWCMDEVERLFACPYAGEFFGLIRSWHNDRANSPLLEKLSVVLAYATEAHLFIQDLNQSPFNVGVKLDLNDFTLEQVDDLNGRHRSPLRSWAEVQEFYNMLNGQPFLVRRGLFELTRPNTSLDKLKQTAAREDGPFGDHLRRILVTLARNEDLCDAVRGLLADGSHLDRDQFYRLQRAGIFVGESAETAKPRCPLYATYLQRHLLSATSVKQAVSYP